MPRATWPLRGGRPSISIALMPAPGLPSDRDLLADTGADRPPRPLTSFSMRVSAWHVVGSLG